MLPVSLHDASRPGDKLLSWVSELHSRALCRTAACSKSLCRPLSETAAILVLENILD